MADGKWIEGLKADLSLTEAARLVLGVRLRIVRDHLPRAIFDSERDPEHVHQLRVGTRRADAALRIFRSCLPGRVYKAARARLRAIRQAAGVARDWDVFLLALADRQAKAPSDEQPGLDFLLGYALGQRQAAQQHLILVDQEEGQAFAGFVSEVVNSIRLPHEMEADPGLVGLARPLMTNSLHDLHRAASGDLKDYDHLHEVRIAGKRLRYAMEVFASCFAPPFRDQVYPLVEEMQETLGRANDSHVAIGRLTALRERLRTTLPGVWDHLRTGIESLLRFHQRRLPQERKKFLRWWEQWTKTGVEQMLLEQTAERMKAEG